LSFSICFFYIRESPFCDALSIFFHEG